MIGIFERKQLDVSDRELGKALASGRLVRVARGWYADVRAPEQLLRAIRLGARAGCVSGAEFHGVWAPPGRDLHCVVRRTTAFPRPSPGVLFHRSREASWPNAPCYPLMDCLRQIIDSHSADTALACLESAVEQRLITQTDLETLIAGSTGRRQRALALFRRGAGSGLETLARLHFQRAGVRVRTQVAIALVGTVDLLVGDSLIVEVDGRAYHDTTSQFEYDRHRDLAAESLGYTVVRLSYQQVIAEWDATRQLLDQLVRQRRHLRQASASSILGWADQAGRR